jgi:FkbM family methyltransferase
MHSGKQYYSHFGEDALLDFIFRDQLKGVYVDVGAYHPVLFSNTKRLYDRGWRGINIDPNIESIKLFQNMRPDDINLNYAISDESGLAEYYKFLEIDENGGGSSNSLSKEVREKYESDGYSTQVSQVEVRPLNTIFKKYIRKKKIDLLNVDVEAFDLQVLKSNDWETYRPRVVAVEIWLNEIDYDHLENNPTYQFLQTVDYKAFSSIWDTWFFFDKTNPIFQRTNKSNVGFLRRILTKIK